MRMAMACVGLGLVLATAVARAGEAAGADGSAAESAEKMPFLGGFLRETRVVYPLQLDGWKAVGEHIYEDQAFGVSVRYVHGDDSDRWIDLYFYPAGVLVDEDLDRMAAQERASLRQVRVDAGEPEPDLGPLRRFALQTAPRNTDDKAGPEGYSLDLTYVHDGRQAVSALALALDRLYFIKGRYSVFEGRPSREEVRTTLEGFLAQLLPQVEITSSGGCWMPLPIEPLPGDAPAPEGAAATLDTDGTPMVWLMRDRVLAREPDSPAARTMMMLGMSMGKRLFPGCDGAEPSNPVVPEGKREIRLEYRRPDESGPAGGRGTRVRLG